MHLFDRFLAKSVKRFGTFFVCLLFLMVVLTACSGSPTTAPSNNTASPSTTANTSPTRTGTSQLIPTGAVQVTPVGKDKRVVLTVWTLNWRNNPEYEKFFNGVLDAYNKLHPDTTIDWVDLGNDTPKVLSDLLPDGKLSAPVGGVNIIPDLVLLNPIDLYQFAGTNQLEDLNTLVNNDQKDRYLPNAWEGLQLGSASYGVPWVGRTKLTLINKEMWQLAKFNPNSLPKNFDDLDKALPALLNNTPKDVWSVWMKPDVLADFMMEGSRFVESDANSKYKVVFNNTATLGKWQYYANRRKDKYFFDACSNGATEGFDCFAKAKIAVLLDGGYNLPQIKSINADQYTKNTLVGLHPLSKSGTLPLIYQGWAVPKNAPNKTDAADFALFIANDENQLSFSKIVQTVVPTTKKALADPFFNGQDEPLAQARSLTASFISKTSPAEKLLPNNVGIEVRDRLLKSLTIAQDAVWNATAKVTPQEALNEAEKAWKDILK
jgi:putative chitobiose transport system substrate-binding protein